MYPKVYFNELCYILCEEALSTYSYLQAQVVVSTERAGNDLEWHIEIVTFLKQL